MFHHVTATNCTTTAVVPFFLPLFSVNMCNHFPFIRSTFSAIMISTKKEKRRWRRQNRHKIICAQKEGKLVQRQRTHTKRMGEQKKNSGMKQLVEIYRFLIASVWIGSNYAKMLFCTLFEYIEVTSMNMSIKHGRTQSLCVSVLLLGECMPCDISKCRMDYQPCSFCSNCKSCQEQRSHAIYITEQ